MSKQMEKDGESEINRERRRERQGRVKKKKESQSDPSITIRYWPASRRSVFAITPDK